MLFKSTLVTAVLLGQSLAAPTYSIKIKIDVEDGFISVSPQGYDLQVKPVVQVKQPVFPNDITADEIKNDLQAIEHRANATAKAASEAKKSNENSIKAVVNDLALQAYGLINLANAAKDSHVINSNDTEKVGEAYWTMTNAIYAELRAIVKANQTLCSSSALADFDQNLDSLSGAFVSATDALLELVPLCQANHPRDPACIFRGDAETAKVVVPDGIEEVKFIFGGDAAGCPYKASALVLQELK